MARLRLFFLLTIWMFFNTSFGKQHYPVNAILGDISYIQKFGHAPDHNSDEIIRIKTHLEFVEKILRLKDVSSISVTLQNNRLHMLDLLHAYWTAGIFPGNFDFPEMRIPCFIDRENRICAVGYLIEQTAGREIPEQINIEFQYSSLLDMNDATVDGWITSSGLTKIECAMIQPTYNYEPHVHPTPDEIEPIPITDSVKTKYHAADDKKIVTVNKRKKQNLAAESVNQNILTDSLYLSIDSLHLVITHQNEMCDSLTKIIQEKDTTIDVVMYESEMCSKNLTVIIRVLILLIGLVFILIKIFRSKRKTV